MLDVGKTMTKGACLYNIYHFIRMSNKQSVTTLHHRGRQGVWEVEGRRGNGRKTNQPTSNLTQPRAGEGVPSSLHTVCDVEKYTRAGSG